MPRYSNYGPLDNRVVAEGDQGFRAIDSYLESTTLTGGFVQESRNMRLLGDIATVRKGWDFLAATASGPLNSFSYSSNVDEVFASGKYSDPDDDNQDWLVLATKSKVLIWNKSTPNGLEVLYYSATVAHTAVDTSAETITISSHKFQVGDTVQVSTTDTIPAGLAINTTYYVIDASVNTIKLATTLANALAGTAINITSQGAGNHTIQSVVILAQAPSVTQAFSQVYVMRKDARPLVWDGDVTATGSTVDTAFEALSSSASGSGDPFPSTNVSIYFRNRLIGPQPFTTATPTTAKTGAQIIVCSDLLSPNNVTSAASEFYLNLGSADFFVGMIGYLENQLIVFLRHSVHLITNLHATTISEHYEITREYGCVAAGSIAQSGAQTYFLSDQGVMVLTPQGDPGKGMGIVVSKVQSETLPLSRPIESDLNDPVTGINFAHVSKAAGVIWDNHYYLSIPMEVATTPTTVWVYSILQEGWVSRDTYAEGILDWVVMPYGTAPERSRLFATMPKGFYLFEEVVGLDDTGREIGDNSRTVTTAIAAKLKTRSYTFGDLSIKSWHRGQLGVDVTNGDAFTVKLNTTDPNTIPAPTVHTESASATEDKILRFGLARTRGYSASLEVDVTAGGPTFRHVVLEASGVGLNVVKEVA